MIILPALGTNQRAIKLRSRFMETTGKSKFGLKKALALLSLSISGSAIYQLPYLRYVFYDDLNAAFNMTNQQ